jgi:FkbM family methyltransferase
MGFAIYWSGFHEFREFLFLHRFLKKEMVFVDIGANLGEYSVFAAKRVRAGRVLAFEPLPGMVKRLKENIDLNGFSNVDILPIGLSDTEAILPIHEIDDSHEGLSTFYPGSMKSKYRVEVPLKILDSEVRNLGVNRVDFIKMDIEGGELGALKGARKTIEHYRPVLMVEINEATYRAAGYETADVGKFFNTLGYGAFTISKNLALVPCLQLPVLGNVIFKPV